MFIAILAILTEQVKGPLGTLSVLKCLTMCINCKCFEIILFGCMFFHNMFASYIFTALILQQALVIPRNSLLPQSFFPINNK